PFRRVPGYPGPVGTTPQGCQEIFVSATSVVFVGGGPRVVSLVERLAANLAGATGVTLDLHVVDPFPAGGGRIWRHQQSELLWMSSRARDVTVFTDDSVRIDGPVAPGPALHEWVESHLGANENAPGPDDFASRQVQAQYLRWAWKRAVTSLPVGVTVHEHRRRAVAVADVGPTRQVVTLDDGQRLEADVVVLAQGYLDREATPVEQE